VAMFYGSIAGYSTVYMCTASLNCVTYVLLCFSRWVWFSCVGNQRKYLL